MSIQIPRPPDALFPSKDKRIPTKEFESPVDFFGKMYYTEIVRRTQKLLGGKNDEVRPHL